MSIDTTPPVCCHCGRLMIFTTMSIQSSDLWEESWRCPDGGWMRFRSVPPPPGYAQPAALPPPTPPPTLPEQRRDEYFAALGRTLPEWLDAKQVAALLHRCESTIRHLPPDAIPGRQQHAKGYKVRWNKQRVLDWLDRLTRET